VPNPNPKPIALRAFSPSPGPDPDQVGGRSAAAWAQAVAATYAPLRQMLGASYEAVGGTWPVRWPSI